MTNITDLMDLISQKSSLSWLIFLSSDMHSLAKEDMKIQCGKLFNTRDGQQDFQVSKHEKNSCN